MTLTRREALGLLAGGGAAAATSLAAGQPLLPEVPMPDGVPPPALAPKPLPFDPAKLRGLSEKLIASHHDNNYVGAVKNLNAVRADLARLPKDAPAYLVGSLRAREAVYGNSMTLHEAYFGNLGGDGKADGPLAKALAATWGSAAAWEQAFRALGMSLAGGSGWATLNLHLPTGELRVSWAGDHAQALASAVPLVVLDMYEHAYHMDYGAAAAKYVEAFFQNIKWDEVNRRYEAGQAALKALG